MIQKGLIDHEDPSVCLNIENFPRFELILKDAQYKLNSSSIYESNESGNDNQDKKVGEIASLLQKSMPKGKKLKVSTTGVADGTRNQSLNFLKKIQSELTVNGKLDYTKLHEKMSDIDPKGFQALIIAMDNRDPNFSKQKGQFYKSFDNLKNGQSASEIKLLSMLNNFYLAQSRGNDICNKVNLVVSDLTCDNKGLISTELETGQGCYEGCCDGRRGALVNLEYISDEELIKNGKGIFEPKHITPPNHIQHKLQLAGSLDVFSSFSKIELNDDSNSKNFAKLEKAVLENNEKFYNNPKMIQLDRERFKKVLAGSGCEENNFALDSIRRIYWKTKKLENQMDPSLSEGIFKGNYSQVLDFYKKNQKNLNNYSSADKKSKEALNILFTGGSSHSSKSIDAKCSKKLKFLKDQTYLKQFRKCNIISNFNQFSDMDNLLKSVKKNDHLSLLRSKQSPGLFIVFDEQKQMRLGFRLDPNCKDLIAREKTNSKNASDAFNTYTNNYTKECFNQLVQGSAPISNDFYPNVNIDTKVVPTEVFNCLNVSAAYDDILRPTENGQFSSTAQQMAQPYCQVAEDNNLKLKYDLKKAPRHDNGAIGVSICKACNSGLYYDKNIKDFVYQSRSLTKGENARLRNSSKNSSNLSVQTYFQSGKSKTNLTLGAAKHLRTYVIPNCGTSCADACSCLKDKNIQELITKDSQVYDLTSGTVNKLSLQKNVTYSGDKNGAYACLFTPPVSHTCSFAPFGNYNENKNSNANATSMKCPIITELQKLEDKVIEQKLVESATQNYKKNCSAAFDNFPQSENSCLSSQGPICNSLIKNNNCGEQKKKTRSGVSFE